MKHLLSWYLKGKLGMGTLHFARANYSGLQYARAGGEALCGLVSHSQA